ncbi:TetR family transcriptional regulator [Desulfosporosinus sp. HMP52]|uniref:TetR/AcrR family transcriptional regulator n=1 Tax=Desulfosporosinus sp. HMP52 TaxID=1487923 RepID=UPI00051F9DC8|nr:TetR/AcrR family transcriptional regulator [Desulfosporosinus sp. HMP52]KGK91295.1 TetR family transcriptional regulator [Desulfosporosinus sp. HMP52]
MDRRQRKKLQVQKSIVDVAIKLFIEKGVEETTVAEIMEGADFGIGTFYNYFQSKEDILKYALAEKISEVKRSLEELNQSSANPPQKISQLLLILGKIFEENQQLFKVYRNQSLSPIQPPHGPEFKDFLVSVIREGQEKGEFRVTIPIEMVTEMFMGLIQSAITSRSQIPFQENLEYKLDLFLEGLTEKK